MKNQKFNNQITLMPKFIYNKTLFEKPADNNSLVNQFWMFNYFILNEEMAQIYFVPVSTCRYPNQIAKIRVFPDIEWEVAFLITVGSSYSGSIRYERQRLNSIHRDYGLRYLKDDLKIDFKKNIKPWVGYYGQMY